MSETAAPKKRNVGWFVTLVPLTAFWLTLAVAITLEAFEWVDCAGTFRTLSEPPGWRTWPVLPNDYRHGSHTLFGFEFTYRSPRGFWYGGYEDSKLVDPRLCPHSSVDLDGWLRAGESFWMRHPGELSLHRDPKSDVSVIAGRYAFDDGVHSSREPPRFVVAFRRELVPERGLRYRGGGGEVLFWLLALAGVWTIVLKLRRSPRYDKIVIFVVLGSVWLALVSLVVAVVTADWDIR